MNNISFTAEAALAPLKEFQRSTVDYVFDRLYGDKDPVQQFLVADEVGLGKTMVARGVIAKTIERLWKTSDRIDVLYICSNQAIAAQNINRLNVLDQSASALPTRLTLIPLQLGDGRGLDANKVNFISFTPGTTFDLKSTTGVVKERALLYQMLKKCVRKKKRLRNLLQVGAGAKGWSSAIDRLPLKHVDKNIITRCREDITSDEDLVDELEAVCDLFSKRSESYPQNSIKRRNVLIGRLREVLSHACIDALKPDLIIMDEFQGFRDLLRASSSKGKLAKRLFDSSDKSARILLLSATPYRMLTLTDDTIDDGAHYKDFLDTISFLYGETKGPDIAKSLEREMQDFRGLLHRLPVSREEAVESRKKVEDQLRKVMVRTERVANTRERDSMVLEVPMKLSVQPPDLKQAVAISAVARELDAPDITEYWKSSPYLLNFMRDYTIKKRLVEELDLSLIHI